MANDPKGAREKRTPGAPRPNAKGDHEGSAHGTEAFDDGNPQRVDLNDLKSVPSPKSPAAKP